MNLHYLLKYKDRKYYTFTSLKYLKSVKMIHPDQFPFSIPTPLCNFPALSFLFTVIVKIFVSISNVPPLFYRTVSVIVVMTRERMRPLRLRLS